MPKYRFTCVPCNKEYERFASPRQEILPCPLCKTDMHRELPSAGSQAVTEIVDSFTGVRNEDDQKLKTKDRRQEHFWEVEVPRLVQPYSLQTCLEEGWLVYNDKGELVVGKQPKKR